MGNKDKILKNIDRIIYISIICYLLDIIILGGGDLTRFLGISSKMIWFGIAVLLSSVMILFDMKHYITNKSLLAVGGFMVIVAINAIRGIFAVETINTAILISDVKGFLNFLIVIPMIYILNSKERVVRLAKLFTLSLTVLAGIVIILGFYLKFPKSIQSIIYSFLNENTICGIAGLTSNTVRVFFHTASRWFFCGFLFALCFYVLEQKKKWMISMVLQVVAIVLSFTRSIYLGLFVAAIALVIIVLLCYKEEFTNLWKPVGIMCIAVVCSVVLISMIQGENVFSVAINRCILGVTVETPSSGEDETEDEAESAIGTEGEDGTSGEKNILGNLEAEQANLDIREIRKQKALENIAKNPLVGNGLGTVNDPNNELIEYFYLDLISKVGILGLVVFFLPLILASYVIWKNIKLYNREQKIVTLFVWTMVVYLMVISYYNPCMNTTTGLSIYSLLLGVAKPWKESK